MVQGLHVFTSLEAALDAGYRVYDRYRDRGQEIGYIMHIDTAYGIAQAIVDPRPVFKYRRYSFGFGMHPYLPIQVVIAQTYHEAYELLEQENYPVDCIEQTSSRYLAGAELDAFIARGSNHPELLDE